MPKLWNDYQKFLCKIKPSHYALSETSFRKCEMCCFQEPCPLSLWWVDASDFILQAMIFDKSCFCFRLSQSCKCIFFQLKLSNVQQQTPPRLFGIDAVWYCEQFTQALGPQWVQQFTSYFLTNQFLINFLKFVWWRGARVAGNLKGKKWKKCSTERVHCAFARWMYQCRFQSQVRKRLKCWAYAQWKAAKSFGAPKYQVWLI